MYVINNELTFLDHYCIRSKCNQVLYYYMYGIDNNQIFLDPAFIHITFYVN